MNLSEQTITSYFTGKSTPKAETVKKMCIVLCVPVAYILDDLQNDNTQNEFKEAQTEYENKNTSALLNEIEKLKNDILFLRKELEYQNKIIAEKERFINQLLNK